MEQPEPAANLRNLHDVMAAQVDRGHVAGVVTVVSRNGSVAIDAVGRQGFDGPAMQPDTIFRIASLSKPVAAAAQ